MVNVRGFDRLRNISTAIYYMLVGNEFSEFHRLGSDKSDITMPAAR